MNMPLKLAIIFLLSATPAATQSHDHSHSRPEVPPVDRDTVLDSFLARAREAGARYRDRRTAVSDGFRRLGPDFPSMGEHWVHPSRMIGGVLDPDYPQALSYALISGVPTLTGVIYAKPLRPGEASPDFPSGVHAWHDHSGSIDEESVVLRHALQDDGESATRLAMLHVWGELANPGGVFESDNWALPFARLALDVPDRFEIASARALSLASGGDTYYRLLFQLQARPEPEVQAVVEDLIAAAQRDVDEILMRQPRTSTLGAGELAALEQVWVRLWTEAGSHLPPDERAELQDLLMN